VRNHSPQSQNWKQTLWQSQSLNQTPRRTRECYAVLACADREVYLKTRSTLIARFMIAFFASRSFRQRRSLAVHPLLRP
jgi:hypothetical protein